MIEILDQLEVLARAELDLSTLSLAGVHYGTRAAGSIPRDRITQVTLTVPTNDYYGAVGERPSPDDVVDGTIHLTDKVSFKITDGVVTGFGLYSEGHLDHFADIGTYEDFLGRFGTPDRIEKSEAFGNLRGYRNFYWRATKQAYWDSWLNRLTMINLGTYEGNSRLPSVQAR